MRAVTSYRSSTSWPIIGSRAVVSTGEAYLAGTGGPRRRAVSLATGTGAGAPTVGSEPRHVGADGGDVLPGVRVHPVAPHRRGPLVVPGDGRVQVRARPHQVADDRDARDDVVLGVEEVEPAAHELRGPRAGG